MSYWDPCIPPRISGAPRIVFTTSSASVSGGVPRYLEERGHPRLRMRHRPFRIGEAERDRWLELMGAAMVEAEVPPPVAAPLGEFFAQVADFMRNA